MPTSKAKSTDDTRRPTAAREQTVSVIVPTYNAERFVADALRSIMSQQHALVEVIVVDDGSTDATMDVVEAECPAARTIRQSNLGSAAARNRGVMAAQGEFIAFLDADDVWFPGKLKAQLRCLERNPDAGFCFTGWLVGDSVPSARALESRARLDNWPNEDAEDPHKCGWLYTALLIDTIFNTSTMLIRRDVIDRAGRFREDLLRGQDYDYWLRISRIAPGMKLARPFALYRQHANNSIRKPQTRNYNLEILSTALETWGPQGPDGSIVDFRTLRRALSRRCLDFAWLHVTDGDPSIALKSSIDAVRRNPGDVTTAWEGFKVAARAIAHMARRSMRNA